MLFPQNIFIFYILLNDTKNTFFFFVFYKKSYELFSYELKNGIKKKGRGLSFSSFSVKKTHNS